MRYENNDLLREYLHRGAAGPHREHAKHPAFELDADAFSDALAQVRHQHPHLSEPQAEARAAFRLLTRGAPPKAAESAPSPAHHTHEHPVRAYFTRDYLERIAPDAWYYAKLVWAIALLLLALTAVLLLTARAAHGATPALANVAHANASRSNTLRPAAPRSNASHFNAVRANDVIRALIARPPALLPQITGGGSVAARLQFLNGSSLWSSVSASNPLPITCISGCSGGGGGGGSGTSSVDEAAFTEGTTSFAPAGGYYKSSYTALTSGEQGAVALTANRAFHITAYGSGGNELFTSGNAAYVQFPSAQPVSIAATVATQAAGNASVLSGQQAVTVSAAALGTNTTKTVCIKALAANTMNVYVGASGVTTATGMELAPGNAYCVPATNTNLFYVIASATGASVSWVASN
jgi:hypothetical protein